MTQTIDETWELVIPDDIVTCFVYDREPKLCPESIASWIVTVVAGVGDYTLCNGCKKRWQSYGNITTARLI